MADTTMTATNKIVALFRRATLWHFTGLFQQARQDETRVDLRMSGMALLA